MPGIEPRVLHHDWFVGFEHRRIRRIAWNRFGPLEIIETKVQGAPRFDRDQIRADRIAIGEEHRDAYMYGRLARIENAGGLVRDQRRIGERTLRGNITFRDRPVRLSNRRQLSLSLSAVSNSRVSAIFGRRAARCRTGFDVTTQRASRFRNPELCSETCVSSRWVRAQLRRSGQFLRG